MAVSTILADLPVSNVGRPCLPPQLPQLLHGCSELIRRWPFVQDAVALPSLISAGSGPNSNPIW
jgi:hypothetical protein